MRNLRSQNGFTIIEVLVTLMLVVTMVLSVTTLLFVASHSNTEAIDQEAANRQIQQQVDQLRGATFSSLIDGTYNFTTSGIDRVQTAQYAISDYTDSSGSHTSLKQVVATITWKEGNVLKTVSQTTYIAQHGINQQ
jgi:type II secretory pathway pseudopilin PulG